MPRQDLVVPISLDGHRHFVITANGLDALGLHAEAEEQRAAARTRLEESGLLPRVAPADDRYVTVGLDSPAGAGADVEAERG